ncbi:MAG TPA: PAS domain-containing protein [Enhygromyxa sp.]|nr:PAS domain-containing protein [Enhygromyxa sp.]
MVEDQNAEVAPQQLIERALTAPVALWVVGRDGAFDGDPPPTPALADRVRAIAKRVIRDPQPVSEQHDFPSRSESRTVRLVARPLATGGVAVAMLELDPLRQIDARLTRYDLVLRATRDAVWEWNVVAQRVWWSQRVYELLGRDRFMPSFEAWSESIHPDDRARVLREFERVVSSDAPTWEDEFRFVRADGSVGVTHDRGYIERAADGRPIRMIGVMSDVTEQRAATAALAASEERFRQITDAINEVFWLTDESGEKVHYVSPAYETVWGRSCQSVYDDPSTFTESIDPEDQPRLAALWQSSRRANWDEVFRIRRPDGTMVWVRDRAFPVRDERGEVVAYAGVASDITTQRRLEEQLAQSQKLESIGRLAGGIAHDFNNLLTVILTGAQFALRSLAADSPIRVDLIHVKEAAERAAKLTSQLLAFARRQVNEPTRLDLNELTRQTDRLLRRIIGEHIEFTTVLAPGLAPVLADRGQLEQVLVNLVVNARDAMREGGHLTVQTRNVTIDESFAASHANIAAGEYVRLSVSDTGAGIPAEVLPHIFEPFFSTKLPGQSTGLGLATCYGIVRQAGGDILVHSSPGVGTTFEILLPALARDEATIEDAATPSLPSGSETVLFVEDDAAVRFMGARILSEQGYRVLEASSGHAALQLASEHDGMIDILVTDVVMPHMSGIELARRMLEQQPELRVLYTSGYTEHAIVQEGVVEPRIAFLQKPYVLDTLLAKVREILDQP